jgi:hypothetical protein
MLCEGAVVFGLSSSYDVEADLYAPSHLYRFDLKGDSFVDLGPVLLNGAAADFDGLAASQEFGLLAFQSTAGGSRLVQIDPATSTATLLAPPLFGRGIRGATFGATGQFWAVDANLDELVRVSPTTGEDLDIIPLTFNAQPFDLPLTTDLAVRFSGELILVTANEVYTVDENTGQMSLLYTDDQGEPMPPSSQPPSLVGAVIGFSETEKLFAFDVEGAFTDDLYTYELADGFPRELLSAAPLSQIDAALGDLALLLQPVDTGDYNDDGFVDAADYVVWRNTLGSTAVLLANGNDSGTSMSVIDHADYIVWRSNFGSPKAALNHSSGLAPVPEPGQLPAWMCLVLPWTMRRGGRHCKAARTSNKVE